MNKMRVVVRYEKKEKLKKWGCVKERVDEIEGAWKKGGKEKTMRRPEEKKKELIISDRCGISKRPPRENVRKNKVTVVDENEENREMSCWRKDSME
jgi:hypothetical protein